MEFLNLEFITKFVTVAASIFALYKIVMEHVLTKKPRLRDEFNFAKEFVSSVTENTPPIILEKGYLAMTGDSSLTANEIKHLLSMTSPALAMKKYYTLKKYLEFIERTDEKEAHIRFKKECSERKRWWLRKLNSWMFVLFAAFAFTPVLFSFEMFGNDWKSSIVLILFSLGAFGTLAVQFLLEYRKLISSDDIINMQ